MAQALIKAATTTDTASRGVAHVGDLTWTQGNPSCCPGMLGRGPTTKVVFDLGDCPNRDRRLSTRCRARPR
jgi:hypothetical protein